MNEIKREVISSFERTLTIIPESEAWAIFFRGKQVKLLSGKSIWKTHAHAKSALTNHSQNFYYSMRNNFVDLPWSHIINEIKQIVDELISEGIIEIRRIGK